MTNPSNQPAKEACTWGDVFVGMWKRFNVSPERYTQIRNSIPAYDSGKVWGYLVDEARKERIERKARQAYAMERVYSLIGEMFDDEDDENTTQKSEKSNNLKAPDERPYYNRNRF